MALAGTGWAVNVQAPAFRRAGLHIASIYSRDAARAGATAASLGDDVVGTADADELVRSAPIVSIVTPPYTHKDWVVRAVEAGARVVLCEKPMAMNATESASLVALTKESDAARAFLIDHEMRFLAAFRIMRALAQSGALGPLRFVEALVVRPDRLLAAGGSGTILAGWNWWSDASQGGGALGAISSHLCDMTRFVTGAEPVAVQGMLSRVHDSRGDRPVTADDRADLHLRLRRPSHGTAPAAASDDEWSDLIPCVLTASITTAGRSDFRVSVAGTEATVAYEGGVLTLYEHHPSSGRAPRSPSDGVTLWRTRYLGATADEDASAADPRGAMPRNDFSTASVLLGRAMRAFLRGEAEATGDAVSQLDAAVASAASPFVASCVDRVHASGLLGDLTAFQPEDLHLLAASFHDGHVVQCVLDAARRSDAERGAWVDL